MPALTPTRGNRLASPGWRCRKSPILCTDTIMTAKMVALQAQPESACGPCSGQWASWQGPHMRMRVPTARQPIFFCCLADKGFLASIGASCGIITALLGYFLRISSYVHRRCSTYAQPQRVYRCQNRRCSADEAHRDEHGQNHSSHVRE